MPTEVIQGGRNAADRSGVDGHPPADLINGNPARSWIARRRDQVVPKDPSTTQHMQGGPC